MVNKILLNSANRHHQQGVVLIISLIFLVALTAVAAALMQNTTTDMKMSGASEEKVVAEQEAVSAIDEYIYRQVKGGSGNNAFAKPVATFKAGAKNVKDQLVETNKNGDIEAATLDLADNKYMLEADCPHSKSASSAQVFTCNVLRIQVDKKYGRNDTSTIEVNSGIAQHLIR